MTVFIDNKINFQLDYIFPQFEPDPTFIKDIKEYLIKIGKNNLYKKIIDPYLTSLITIWLSLDGVIQITRYFNFIAEAYGIVDLICFLQLSTNFRWHKIAEKLLDYTPSKSCRSRVSKVGILYTALLDGGAEKVIIESVPLLQSSGFEVVLFLEEGYINDRKIPNNARIYYLGKRGGGGELQRRHLFNLSHALQRENPDVLFCHACYSGSLLWQLILIKYLGIPTILYSHSAFYMSLVFPEHDFSIQDMDSLMRLGDKVVALSTTDELYYRVRGINAQYLPNPVAAPEINENSLMDFASRMYNIVVFGRLGEKIKNIPDALEIFAKLLKYRRNFTITFLGSFAENIGQEAFESRCKKLEISDRILVTGWQSNPAPYLDDSSILLCTSYAESFSLTIVEAQSRGLPVVMYELPIMPAIDNESIIQVPQGDKDGAVREIISLIDDPDRWKRLALKAIESSRRFSYDTFKENITNLIHTFLNYSMLSFPLPNDYCTVMKTLGFYAGHYPPWYKKN